MQGSVPHGTIGSRLARALLYFKMNACISDIYFWLTVAHVPLARLRHDRTRLL